ncbi:GNAT family N-acetyltransferase [Sphingomonas morindae]|uniref:GNAT family N-acetyltransferase n=1 Tax=Sphingomonas morindae TaxID=1541170 RepID=A0ABY4X5T7_9SPHN|nr:GNAT family N-acetyltransferase [Sphingomonas morindae]USI72252.1 GNAT family N-acetyltransferase [Sphingomonas morindae]
MSLERLDDAEIGTIVTSLQMTARPRPRPLPPSPLRLDRWRAPAPDRYRALFRRVGTPWLWFSRLVMDEAALVAIIAHPQVELFAVTDARGIELGMVELDFRAAGACEIAYFGLVPEMTGAGHGRWLMTQTLALAWRPGVERVWVHTCTLDHPRALGFYQALGFTPFARAVERFPDPRVIGVLPEDAAPHIPRLASRR